MNSITRVPPVGKAHLRLFAFALAGVLGACSSRGTPTGVLPAVPAAARLSSTAMLPDTQSTVFVTSRGTSTLLGFPKGAHGDVAPSVKIEGSKTKLDAPVGLAVDRTSGTMYVVNDGGHGAASSEVLIFAKGANGNVSPKTISGSKVPFRDSEGVALDASGKVYVSDYKANAVYVFPAGAIGNVAPIRTITGSNTMLYGPTGMAFDANGHLWVVNAYQNSARPALVEFVSNASGNAAPLASIGGSHTKLSYPFNVSVDPNGRIVVADGTSVAIFAAGAHGNVAPSATIAGLATKLSTAVSVGTDDAANIYVTNVDFNTNTSSMVVFGPHAHGNQPPLRVLAGVDTAMNDPFYPSLI